MGVYIKGLNMPTERESFNLTIKYNGLVAGTETGMQVAEAYELPPHGRLGDLDKLKERVTKHLYASNHGSMAEAYFAALIELIDTAPTIIQTEEKKL